MSSRGVFLPGVLSALFFLVVPGTVAGVVPWLISGWRFEPPFLGWAAGRAVGVALLAAGVPVLAESMARFAHQGRGTPAPPFPTERLVIGGLYRYARNPMYLAVLSVIVGQAALFASRSLLLYAGLVFCAFHAFIRLYEEPTLRRRHGAEYDAYCAATPRWIPARLARGAGPLHDGRSGRRA